MSNSAASQPSKSGSTRATSESENSPLSEYLDVLLSRKRLIVAITSAAVAVGAVWTYTRTKIYTSTASVIVDRQAPRVLGKDVAEVVDLSSGSYWAMNEYMRTQERILASDGLTNGVIDELNLVKDPDFWMAPKSDEKADANQRTPDKAATLLRSLVDVANPKKSNIIEIQVSHANPELAAKIANTYAKLYMEQNVNYKRRATAGASKWLVDRLDQLTQELHNADLEMHRFKKDKNIISVSLEDRQSVISAQVAQLNQQLTETKIKRVEVGTLRNQVRTYTSGKIDPLAVPLEQISKDEHIRQLSEKYIDENRKLAGLRGRYLPQHPEYAEQMAVVATSKEALMQVVLNELRTIENQYDRLVEQEAQLSDALQKAKARALYLNEQEVHYNALARHQANTAKLHQVLLQRVKESELSAELHFNNIRTLDVAVPAKRHSKPRALRNLLFSLVLGLFASIGLALFVGVLDSSLQSQEDVDAIPGLVCLGVLPQIAGQVAAKTRGRKAAQSLRTPEVDLAVHRTPKSVVAEHCRAIRTNILFSSPDEQLKRLLVTSASPHEGKTTVATSIAIAMAQAGNRVLIIDTDMRRPQQHRVFSVPGTRGLTNVLLGDGSLDEDIKSTEVPGLFVLPSGPTPPNPAELCQSERLRTLLDEIDQRFDRVILDSPPAMLVTDAVVLGKIASGAVLVGRVGRTSRSALRDTARRFQDVGAPLLGCVLNGTTLGKKRYGYRGGYHYSKYSYAYETEEA